MNSIKQKDIFDAQQDTGKKKQRRDKSLMIHRSALRNQFHFYF